MNNANARSKRRTRRKRGIRKSMLGTPERPRMTVFRSLKHAYVQVVDDLSGKTLAAASTNEKGAKVKSGGNTAGAAEVGKRLAQRAKDAGITQVVFDRNGYRYHGRIKAIADGAREGGLKL